MDFFEKTQAPLTSRQGIRRSVASRSSVASSIARYVQASCTLIMSFVVTVPPPSLGLVAVDRLPERLHLGLEGADALHELLDRLRDRIGQIGLIQVDPAADSLAVSVCYAPRHPDDNRVRRHFAHHDRAGADPAAVADRERPDDLRARADHHVAAERGGTLLALAAGAAKRHALQQRDVRADLRRFADDHAHAAVDEEAGTELRRGMDLDPREEPGRVRDEAVAHSPRAWPELGAEPVKGE